MFVSGRGLFLKGDHRKGRKFYAVFEETVDVQIVHNQRLERFQSFYIGPQFFLTSAAGIVEKNPVFMMNHHSTEGNVQLSLFDLEFVNEAGNRAFVVGVTLLTDVTGLTELVYDYTKGSNRAKKGFYRVNNIF